jgi:peptide chain release factor subunit 3
MFVDCVWEAADQAAEGVAKLSVSDSHDATTELTKASEPEPVVATAAQAQQSQPQEPREAEAAADEEEEVEETDEERRKVYEALAREDSRAHMNIVFIGHVDHGKSTLGGQILVLMGGVDERTIEKYQKEAKENNRETWYMAYVMDTNDEERAKGKTVEVGRAYLATEKRRRALKCNPVPCMHACAVLCS